MSVFTRTAPPNFAERDTFENASRAATQFDIMWGIPKSTRQIFEVVGYRGPQYNVYNDYTHQNTPAKHIQFLEENRQEWIRMVLSGEHNYAVGQLSEVLAFEMLKHSGLPTNSGVSITCAEMDFSNMGMDLAIWGPSLKIGRIDSDRVSLLVLGIDVVRNESQIQQSNSLEQEGYGVYITNYGIPKGLLNLRTYPSDHRVHGSNQELLLDKTIHLLNYAVMNKLDLSHDFSILKVARSIGDSVYLDLFDKCSIDLRRRLQLIIYESSSLVRQKKEDYRQKYSDYLYGMSQQF
jgi:hypothetical protein